MIQCYCKMMCTCMCFLSTVITVNKNAVMYFQSLTECAKFKQVVARYLCHAGFKRDWFAGIRFYVHLDR